MGDVLEKERGRPAIWANSSNVLGTEISNLKALASTASLFLWGAEEVTRAIWLCFGGEGNNFCSIFPSDQTYFLKIIYWLTKWNRFEFEGSPEEWSYVGVTC